MRKKLKIIIYCALLLIVGVLFGLKQLGFGINVFFDGWWAILVSVMFAIALIIDRKLGNIVGIAMGIALFLCCRDVIEFILVAELTVPIITIIIGAEVLIRGFGRDGAAKIFDEIGEDGKARDEDTCCALFASDELDYTAKSFQTAELCTIFGSAKCDLTDAVIENDCAVAATTVFGGIEIIAPSNVNVKINSTSVFGGAESRRESNPDAPFTLYVNAICLFGGVDIK